MDLRQLRSSLSQGIAIQGNLDPVTLTTTPEITRIEAQRVLEQAGTRPGFIFNLGHGMIPSAKDRMRRGFDGSGDWAEERFYILT